jgi:hypothetical protein
MGRLGGRQDCLQVGQCGNQIGAKFWEVGPGSRENIVYRKWRIEEGD